MSRPFDITIATCQNLPEPDPDAAPLLDALTATGLTVRTCVWDDPDVDWSLATLTLIRSTWDYHRKHEAFLRWAQSTHAVSPLFNSPEIVRWNSHKNYLLQLPLRGIPVVPTVLIEKGSTLQLSQITTGEDWKKIVVKPAVSAGSFETHVMTADQLDEPTFQRLVQNEDVLVQPYIDSVDHHGERSLIFINGQFTHCIRKHPRFAGDDEHVTGPHTPTPEERAVAERAIHATGEPLLYARVDLIQNAHQKPLVAELEFIEPSLFFRFSDECLHLLTTTLAHHVTQRSTRH